MTSDSELRATIREACEATSEWQRMFPFTQITVEIAADIMMKHIKPLLARHVPAQQGEAVCLCRVCGTECGSDGIVSDCRNTPGQSLPPVTRMIGQFAELLNRSPDEALEFLSLAQVSVKAKWALTKGAKP